MLTSATSPAAPTTWASTPHRHCPMTGEDERHGRRPDGLATVCAMDPMDMAKAIMALQQQAAQELAACKQDLAARELGFDADDQRAIAESAAAHPFPAGYVEGAPPSEEDIARSQAVAAQAASAEYPMDGFPPGDPRLAPIDGVTLPLYAIANHAIGWSTEQAYIDRIVTKLGIDPATWATAGPAWNERIAADIVLATYYGQLFSQA